MKKGLVLLLAGACASAAALDWKLPVTSAKYEVGQGSSEDVEEEGMQPDSLRHTISLTVKEEARPASFSLGVVYSEKDYLDQIGDYRYISTDQEGRVRLSEAVALGLALAEKWVWYPDRDPADPSHDYLALKAAADASVAIARGSGLDATLTARVEAAREPARSRQMYSLSAGFTSRIGEWQIGARYRGEYRLPLGPASLVSISAYNTGTLSIQWDPNR